MFGFVCLNFSVHINSYCFALNTAAAVDVTTAELSTPMVRSGSSRDSAIIFAAVLVPVFVIVAVGLVVLVFVIVRRRRRPASTQEWWFVFSFITLLQTKGVLSYDPTVGSLREFTCSITCELGCFFVFQIFQIKVKNWPV